MVEFKRKGRDFEIVNTVIMNNLRRFTIILKWHSFCKEVYISNFMLSFSDLESKMMAIQISREPLICKKKKGFNF